MQVETPWALCSCLLLGGCHRSPVSWNVAWCWKSGCQSSQSYCWGLRFAAAGEEKEQLVLSRDFFCALNAMSRRCFREAVCCAGRAQLCCVFEEARVSVGDLQKRPLRFFMILWYCSLSQFLSQVRTSSEWLIPLTQTGGILCIFEPSAFAFMF